MPPATRKFAVAASGVPVAHGQPTAVQGAPLWLAVDDCRRRVSNQFELVVVANYHARHAGVNHAMALREIGAGIADVAQIRCAAIRETATSAFPDCSQSNNCEQKAAIEQPETQMSGRIV